MATRLSGPPAASRSDRGRKPDHSEADFYFQRFGFCGRQIAAPAPRDLGLVVVIPCFNEPDLLGSLESLANCDPPGCAVEVIVVVNSSVSSGEEVRLQNQRTLEQAAEWARNRPEVHLLHFPDLPAKHAGVGLARKIGMDEAARRLDDVRNTEGVIVGFDADCRCQRNYLTCLEQHFRRHRRSPGCSIYFEHPLTGAAGSKLEEAIVAYELHLRYYVQALRYAGFPYAHHTIGSCMAVRAEVYKKQGGMNKRQAAEDFYFLHKIIPLGGFTDLVDTTVFPSPRASDRVPFGTGKAVGDYLIGQQIRTYPLRAFLDLKQFFECLPELFQSGVNQLNGLPVFLPESIQTFLGSEAFVKVMKEIGENTASEAAFRKRFFHWFDGFRAMKFIHHARDRFYGQGNVAEEARALLTLKGKGVAGDISVRELLGIYRRTDRGG